MNKWHIIAGIISVVIVALGVVASAFVYFAFLPSYNWPTEPFEYSGWVIICDAPFCADIGKEIYLKGGAIGDVAVATLLCMGVTSPHRSGLGGSFMALVHNGSTGEVVTLDAMGHRRPSTRKTCVFNPLYGPDGLGSIFVAGAPSGYALLHERFGKLPWKELFAGAISLAKDGFPVGRRLAEAIWRCRERIKMNILRNNCFKVHGQYLTEGEMTVHPKMAALLQNFSIDPSILLDKADLTYGRNAFSCVEHADFSAFKAEWKAAASFNIGDNIVHTSPYPGSGILLAAALKETLNIKEAVLEPRDTLTTPTMSAAELHRFVEKLKFAFALRSEVRQENFGPQEQQNLFNKIRENFYNNFRPDSALPAYADYGGKYPIVEDFVGAHLLIRDPHDNAISITASLNSEFGAATMLDSGAFFLNNYVGASWRYDMGKDPLPLMPPNHVITKARPAFTSMVPTIIASKGSNKNKLIAVLGSTGGLDSVSTLAQFIECITKFPIFSCVMHNVRVHPELNKTFTVKVGPPQAYFAPGDLLNQFGDSVEMYANIFSSATGILKTNRGSWMAPADTAISDGSTTGDPYVHPVYNRHRD